jgi:hypothetical protein
MERLEAAKKEIAERLLTMEDFNLDQRLIPVESFEHFAAHARRVLQETPDFNWSEGFCRNLLKELRSVWIRSKFSGT